MQKPNSDHVTTGSAPLPVRATWTNRFSKSFHSIPMRPTMPLMNPTPWISSFSVMWESVCSDLKSATSLGPHSRRTLDSVWIWRTTSEVQEEEEKEEEEGDDLKRAMRERSWGAWDFTRPSIDGLWRELRLWLSCHGKWRFCFQHILKKMWSVMHSAGTNKISLFSWWGAQSCLNNNCIIQLWPTKGAS